MLINTIISVAYIFEMFAICQAKFYRQEGRSSDKAGHLSRVTQQESVSDAGTRAILVHEWQRGLKGPLSPPTGPGRAAASCLSQPRLPAGPAPSGELPLGDAWPGRAWSAVSGGGSC